MALTSSDTNVPTLVINKCTKGQYDAMPSHSGSELYIVPEDIDGTPTQDGASPISSGAVYAALSGKQDTLTFDDTPRADSTRPVTSAGILAALENAGIVWTEL